MSHPLPSVAAGTLQTCAAANGAAFDRLAPTYDTTFTDSLIGRAQRSAVWRILLKSFHPHDNLLELNCGTGEDALFLGAQGISVFACDASQQMIARADQRHAVLATPLPVVFCHLATECIGTLAPTLGFDGVFSNFSGLNCVTDLHSVSAALAALVKDDAHLILCLSTRFCLVEILYYLGRGDWRKAFRRCRGSSQAVLKGLPLTVYYPTLRQIGRAFKPHFCVSTVTGVGVFIPPSYLESWAGRHPRLLRSLSWLERYCAGLPLLRSTGDHVLLCLKRVTP